MPKSLAINRVLAARVGLVRKGYMDLVVITTCTPVFLAITKRAS
jgi:hypothetical protein